MAVWFDFQKLLLKYLENLREGAKKFCTVALLRLKVSTQFLNWLSFIKSILSFYLQLSSM